MKFNDLELDQKDAIAKACSEGKRTLGLGPPGTGKTTTALWAARTFLENASPDSRVLFLTFSRAAVGQIASRQAGVLAGFEDRIEIQTFHALAFRILRAFGHLAGLERNLTIQSETRAKIFGTDNSKLRFKDLLPAASNIIQESSLVMSLVGTRWGLVICDEAQDLNPEQFALLKMIAKAKVLLFGDPGQMIYEFLGASSKVFDEVKSWVECEVTLSSRSHRDPSGLIPAVAEAVKSRDFTHDALIEAVHSHRLVIHFDTPDPHQLACSVIRSSLSDPGDIGVFAHSNAAVAELAQKLDDEDIDHVLVGIPEAESEGLGALAAQICFSAGTVERAEVCESLAVFLTAAVRSRDVPYVAQGLLGQADLPLGISTRLDELFVALRSPDLETLGQAAELATTSWRGLAVAAAYRPWDHAATHFLRLIAPLASLEISDESCALLLDVVQRSQSSTLLYGDYTERNRVKLMNYHQTKGREADTVVHVFRNGEYYGDETEPFAANSKLLNVAVSRARNKLIIILPSEPHELVEPFGQLQDLVS